MNEIENTKLKLCYVASLEKGTSTKIQTKYKLEATRMTQNKLYNVAIDK